MVLLAQPLRETAASVEQFNSDAPVAPWQPYPQAIAYVAINPGDVRTTRADIVRRADWTAAVAEASLKEIRQGIRELPKFLARMLTYDHVIASCGGSISMNARVLAASWTGLAETTFHVTDSYRWIIPFAIERFVTEISASQADVPSWVSDAHLTQDMRVVRRSAETPKRLACAFVGSSKDRLPAHLFRASTSASELGASLRQIYFEDPALNDSGIELRRMAEDLRAEKYDVVLFEDGDPAELSVKVKIYRGDHHFQTVELVSSFKGAPPLLDALASLIGDTTCRFRSTLETAEAA